MAKSLASTHDRQPIYVFSGGDAIESSIEG
jgi:hypothetical protein